MNNINSMLLSPGDTVSFVAPARKVSPSDVASAVALFESWGLKVRIPEGLFAEYGQFAGRDSHRAMLLQREIDDPEVRAIVCVRGGYGTVRVIDKIDFSTLQERPKWIVGYSDITVIHSHLACCYGVPSLHAIMPVNIPADAATGAYTAVDTLRDWLFGGGHRYTLSLSADTPRRVGECRAPIVGGNLSVLYSLLGSSSDINTDGKILLIEDLDEYLYHIDRMMMALKRAGKLSNLKGLVVGAMTEMHDNAVPFGRSAMEIVFDAVSEYGYPVACGCPFGHIGVENLAIPLGVAACLKVTENSVVIDFAAC